MQGTIRSKNEEKMFGFITPEGGAKDVFFHTSAVVGCTFQDLKVGDMVSFDSQDSEKGPRATKVEKM